MHPIYVSTGAVPGDKITDRVETLARAGFREIELTGGTRPYTGMLAELQALKQKLGLQYLIHNYFPPPQEAFVLNLASLDSTVGSQSETLIFEALEWCKELGSKAYSFHAGFFFDPKISELGASKKKRELYPEAECRKTFWDRVSKITKKANSLGVEIYIENNVLDPRNYAELGGVRAAMFLTADEILTELSAHRCNLLLDSGHLKVSAQTFARDFVKDFTQLLPKSSYLQLSDNDGTWDANLRLKSTSAITSALGAIPRKAQWVSLEVYESIDGVKESYQAVMGAFERHTAKARALT